MKKKNQLHFPQTTHRPLPSQSGAKRDPTAHCRTSAAATGWACSSPTLAQRKKGKERRKVIQAGIS